jgi:hypothetical protein
MPRFKPSELTIIHDSNDTFTGRKVERDDWMVLFSALYDSHSRKSPASTGILSCSLINSPLCPRAIEVVWADSARPLRSELLVSEAA